MGFYIGAVCFVISVMSVILYKRILNPIFIFNIWWGISIFISGLGLFDLYIPSNKTYLLILITILSFSLSCALMIMIFKRRNKLHESFEKVPNNILLVNIITYVVLIILIFRTMNVYQLSKTPYFYANIRYNFYYTNLILKNNISSLINNFFVEPSLWFFIIYNSITFFDKKNTVKLIMWINILLYSYSSGARTIIFYALLAIVFSYILRKKEIKIKFTKKIVYITFITFLIGTMIYIGFARSLGNENIIKNTIETVISYFTNSFYFLDVKLRSTPFNETVFWGTATFGGVFDVFKLIINNLFSVSLNTASQVVGGYSQIFEFVAPFKSYNAFPTMIYTFIFDWGYLGTVLGGIIFGSMSGIVYSNFENKKNVLSFGLFVTLIIIIFESTLRWSLIFIWPYYVFALLYFINYKMKKK